AAEHAACRPSGAPVSSPATAPVGRRRPRMTSATDLVARLVRALDEAPQTPIRVSGLRGSAPGLCLARVVAERPRPVVAVLATSSEAEAFAADVRFYLGDP